MPHQTLQDLQRYTGIQHMHRIGMTERMWRDRDRERHTISGSGGNRLPNPGPDRSVRHFPDPRFLSPACSFITPFHGDFQCGHHRLQLADVPGVGERNQPVSLLPGIAMSMTTVALWTRDMRRTRLLYLTNSPFWFTYDILARSYSCMVIEAIAFVSYVVAVWRFDIKKQPQT